MGERNVAGDGDQVDLQVGQIHGRKGADRAAPKSDPKTEGRSENVRTDNARVGRQADVIRGGLSL